MDLQDFGAIGELISAIAVVVSLVYLAVQIRQNTATVRHTAFHEAVRDQATAVTLLSQDAELNRIVYEGTIDYQSLSTAEKRRFETFEIVNLRLLENLLLEADHGRVDPRSWEGVLKHIKLQYSLPGIVDWWRIREDIFHERLRTFMNDEVIGSR